MYVCVCMCMYVCMYVCVCSVKETEINEETIFLLIFVTSKESKLFQQL